MEHKVDAAMAAAAATVPTAVVVGGGGAPALAPTTVPASCRHVLVHVPGVARADIMIDFDTYDCVTLRRPTKAVPNDGHYSAVLWAVGRTSSDRKELRVLNFKREDSAAAMCDAIRAAARAYFISVGRSSVSDVANAASPR